MRGESRKEKGESNTNEWIGVFYQELTFTMHIG